MSDAKPSRTKRQWVCEIRVGDAWEQRGTRFGSLGAVRRSWAIDRVRGWVGPAPSARARNITTGETAPL
jgi:hypothetical protein